MVKHSSSTAAWKLPPWLGGLLKEEAFFSSCFSHEHRKKNEKNIFCLGCCCSICPHCASSSAHITHPLLQVRRYVYHDVVRLDDLEKLIDCSYVQPYTINSAKVVFLKQRPQSRPFKGSGNFCWTCDRILQEPFHFCSLSCKVEHGLAQGNEMDAAQEGDLGEEEDGQITPVSTLEGPIVAGGSSGGSSDSGKGSFGGSYGDSFHLGNVSSSISFPKIVVSFASRRKKSAPHRSPLS
ncbi:protein RGF1 INDUCIBLE TRANSCRIPTION FACTOR 1-like [Wolffia australiana]